MEKPSLVERGLRVKKRTSYSKNKKRKCSGNQFYIKKSKVQEIIPAESLEDPLFGGSANESSISQSKLEEILGSTTPKQTDPNICGYRFVDLEILSDISECMCCPQCKSTDLKLHEVFSINTWICLITTVIM